MKNIKIYLILFSLAVIMLISACTSSTEVSPDGQDKASEVIDTDQNLQDANAETSPDTAEVETPENSQMVQAQNRETPDFSFPANYCPLTTEMVKQYCGINFELALDRENCAVTSANGEGQALMFFPINIRAEYSNYGVSNFRDFIEADIEATKEMNSDEGEFCEVKSFTRDNLGDEAIVTSGVLVKTTPNSCADSNANNPEDLTLFGLNVRKGNNNIAILEGGGSVFSASNSERCSLEEVENLVRVELLGEEIEVPEETAKRTAPVVPLIPASCPPSNLVAWWGGNGNTLDALKDLDALPIESSMFSSGKYGQAFSFSVNPEKSSVPKPLLVEDSGENLKIHVTDQFTVMTWIKVQAPYASGLTTPLVDGGSYGIRMNTLRGDITFELFFYDPSERRHTDSRLIQTPYGYKFPYNQWVHVAATTDKGNQNLKLYINGELVANQSYATPKLINNQGDANLRIGWNFEGSMDEIMIFDRELSQGEILGIMELPNSCALPESIPVTSCVTAPTGLAGWWPGDGNGEDIIGNNNAEVEPGIQYEEGIVAQAFSTLPSMGGPEIKVPDSEVVDLNGDYTIMAWVKRNRLFTAGLLYKHGLPGDSIYSLGFYYGTPRLFRDYVSASLDFQIPKNEWIHIAVTGHNNNQQVELYVNGIFAGARTSPEPKPFLNSNEPLYIGGMGAEYLGDSKIDEVMIFNRALSRDEIQKMVSAGSYGVCKS